MPAADGLEGTLLDGILVAEGAGADGLGCAGLRTGDRSGLLAGDRGTELDVEGEVISRLGLEDAGPAAAGPTGLAAGAVGRTGDRSGLVQGDTLEDCGVGVLRPGPAGCDLLRVSSRMKEEDASIRVWVVELLSPSLSFLGSSTPPSGMVRKHLMGVNRSGLVLSPRSCRWNSSLAREPSELYSGDFSLVEAGLSGVLGVLGAGVGWGDAFGVTSSRTGDVSLLVEPFRVSDDDFRVSSRVQVADEDTEVLLLLRRRPDMTHASLSSAVLEAGDTERGLSRTGLARGEDRGEAPGVPDRFLVAARDALDVKRRLSLLAVLLRRIVDESNVDVVVDVVDLVGDCTRGRSLTGDALLLSGVVPRLPFRGEDGLDEGRELIVVSLSTEPRDSMERVGVARAEVGVGLARRALAKYWCVGLRSWLTRLLL